MQNKRLYMDIHVIQTLPPSNINRDETGSPKTALYGGVDRARVSSQAWKRAMREYFLAHSDESHLGVRTIKLGEFIAKKMMELEPTLSLEDALKKVDKGLKGSAFKLGKNYELSALTFIGNKQATELARLLLEDKVSKEQVIEVVQSNQALDIALFGRMMAGETNLNEEASSQVAHAISTHGVQTEYDYFTALDDLKTDSSGSAMIGTVEFNSSTLYRYANLSLHDLRRQLTQDFDLLGAVELYIDSFINSLPTGKQNTFANQTMPSYVLVTLREDRPISLVGAFEEAVESQTGYTKESIIKLKQEFTDLHKFIEPSLLAVEVSKYGVGSEDIETKDSMVQLKTAIKGAIEHTVEGWG